MRLRDVAAHQGQAPSRPLVVVPAWNESPVIAATLRELKTELPDMDVLVVDDGSTDSTAAHARAAGAQVAQLPFNLGVGGAMRVGFAYAQRNGYDAVVQLDADGQHRPCDVVQLLGGLAEHDLVIGNRFAGEGFGAVGLRRWAMTLLSMLIGQLAGTPLHDTTSGLRATGERLIPLYAQHYPAEYLGDTIESLVIAIRSGFRVTQTAVTMRPRQAGEPTQSLARASLYLARAAMVLALSMVRRWPTPVAPASIPHIPQPRGAA